MDKQGETQDNLENTVQMPLHSAVPDEPLSTPIINSHLCFY